MSSASPRNAFLIAAIMILVSQSAFVFDLFDDSGLENESEIFESGSGSGGVSLSPASTTVTLTNNTAMSPITYQYLSGSGMENGVPVGIMLGGGEFQQIGHIIDSNDKHHLISYNGRVSTGLYYTTNSGGSWTTTMLDSGSYGLGYESDIEVDSNNNPHVVYEAGSAVGINYTYLSNGVWSTPTTIDVLARNNPKLVIDSNDKMHVVSVQRLVSNGVGNYTTNVGGSWVSESFYTGANQKLPRSVDIALNSSGNVTIAFILQHGSNSPPYSLTVYEKNGSTWDSEQVDYSQSISTYKVELQIDSYDVKHLYYYKGGPQILNDASGTWSSNLYTLTTGGLGDMKIEANGTMHVVYKEGSSLTITFQYSTNITGSWITKEIANMTGSTVLPTYNALELDSQGNLHYFFRNNSWSQNGTLYHLVENGVSTVGGGSSGSSGIYNGNGTTWMVADINSGGVENIQDTIVVGTRLFFTANDGTNGDEMWTHETTNDSTWMVADIRTNNGVGGSEPADYMAVGTRIFFAATNNSNDRELWAHEMSNNSTWRVADITDGSQTVYLLSALGTRLFFNANDGTNGSQLWVHETTNDSTWMAADINTGGGSSPSGRTTLGTRFYFSANDGNGADLWAYEVTNESFWKIEDLTSASTGSYRGFLSMGTRLYYAGINGTVSEIWAYETTNDTTWQVTNVSVGSVGWGYHQPHHLTAIGSQIIFTITTSASFQSLWIHDTTNETTWNASLIDISWSDTSQPFANVGTRLFFQIGTASNGNELGAFEITNESSWMVDDIWSGAGHGNPNHIVAMEPYLFFQANDGTISGLFAYDPIGVTVNDPNNGPVTNATCEISPTLPTGITLTQGTCTISGTPSVTQSATTYTLWVNDTGLSYSAIVDITIESGDPVISPASTTVTLTNNTAMTPITYNWVGGGSGSGSGGPNNGPVTSATLCWISPALPTGITLTQGTCTISGTPTVTQSATTYTLWVNDSGISDTATIDITIDESVLDPPSILPASISVVLTNTTAMTPISFSNSGGAVDSWEVDPALPDGLSLASGTISGTPTTVQTAADYTVWANNSDGADSAIVTITINELLPDPPSILPASISVVLTNTTAMSPIEFTNSGGIIDTWEIYPDLPSGLAFDTSNGTISGTPTIVQAASDYTVWANNTGGSDSAIVTITINELLPDPPSISPASISVVLTNTTAMSPIEFTNSGGIIDTWQISPALSPGLTINSENGTISGTPTTVENAIAYTVWANNTGGSDSAIVTITVEEMLPDPPEISYDSPVVLTQYQQMTPIVPTNTGGDVDTWGISPALSSGLTMSSVDGTISGIPLTVENAIAYTIWANNTGGSDSAVLVITVEVAPDGLSITSPNITLVRDSIMPTWYFFYIGDNITSWEISPDLPPGLIFDFANNSIIGTPTEIMDATTYTIWANSSIITESINVTIEVLEDTDGDGMPDDLGDRTDTGLIEDLDDDADGISDEDELASIPLTDSLLPDTDGDGRCDGAVNVTIRGVQICEGGPDLFPTDPSAWQDTDGDGDADDVIGNSTSEPPLVEDLDDDNDGLSDVNETIEGSLTDSKLPDTDYDGVCDGEIEVWFNGELICTAGPDAFPNDPTEWIDTDDDGIGNNADLDDDGDQSPDIDEIAADTDPLDPLDFPTDDSDGDGWTDSQEEFCGTDKLDNMSIPTDNDDDLWCDSDDPDDDNDEWFDTDEDDCGTDSLDVNSVPGDADGDGICDSLEVVIPDLDNDGFPWWLCFLFLIVIIIILPLILRLVKDAEPENTTITPEVTGTGLIEDPFILTPVEGIDPGEIVLSEETITIANMSPEMKVPIVDLNQSENGRRFLLVDEKISEEGVPMIVANEEGSVEFRLSFDDSADPSLAGGTYDSMLKVGRNSVYFKWNVTVESDPDYVKDVDETLDDVDEDDEVQLDSEESEKDAKKAEKAEAKAKKADEAELKKAEASMTKEEKKAAGIERVKANAAKIDFAAIGVATMDDRDDLQALKGVGPFLEEKLNALGIYTFKQISKMSSELEDQVNIAIEFFPGRVKRDQWVDQCKTLLNDD